MLSLRHSQRRGAATAAAHHQSLPPTVTAQEAVQAITSHNNIFVHGMAATPTLLTTAMTQHGIDKNLEDINVFHMHTEGPCPYVTPEASKVFNCKTFFLSGNVREAVRQGRAQYIPSHMSDVPRMLRAGVLPIDVALVSTCPPDKDGYVSLGTSVEATLAALEVAKVKICQVNEHVPRTHGQARLHLSQLDMIVPHNSPLYNHHSKPISQEDVEIARHIATHLVSDGATIQLGIGNIPNMVLELLKDHKHLGVHSEMFSDGLIPLIQSGVVDNSRKTLDKGKLVVSFLLGSQTLFDFVHDNPLVDMRDVAYTNDIRVIAQQRNMTAINSAIEVDVTGQVCAGSMGAAIYSGFGGQVDFMAGAGLSEGGKAIIALRSRTNKGIPRIVPTIREGGGVVTTRATVQYIVTEYGIASLRGKTTRERAKQLIAIAHPEDRDALTAAARKMGLLR